MTTLCANVLLGLVLKDDNFLAFAMLQNTRCCLYTFNERVTYVNGFAVRYQQNIKSDFGSDLSISDYSKGSQEWRATLIFTGKDLESAQSRYDAAVRSIVDECGASAYVDETPEAF